MTLVAEGLELGSEMNIMIEMSGIELSTRRERARDSRMGAT